MKNEKMTEECEKMVYDSIIEIQPDIEEAIRARNVYDKSPSIVNGSKRQEASRKVQEHLAKAIEKLLYAFKEKYSDAVTLERFIMFIWDCVEKINALCLNKGGVKKS